MGSLWDLEVDEEFSDMTWWIKEKIGNLDLNKIKSFALPEVFRGWKD